MIKVNEAVHPGHGVVIALFMGMEHGSFDIAMSPIGTSNKPRVMTSNNVPGSTEEIAFTIEALKKLEIHGDFSRFFQECDKRWMEIASTMSDKVRDTGMEQAFNCRTAMRIRCEHWLNLKKMTG